MASAFREAEKANDSVYRRWQQAKRDDNVSEMYVATQDYEENIKKQEEALNKMDPNSKEYDKAQQSLDAQKQQKWDMECDQRRMNNGQGKQKEIDRLKAKNDGLSKDMDKAIEKGDMKRYDQLKSQYDKNVSAQEKLCKDAQYEGYKPKEEIIQQKAAGVDKDVHMRDKIAEKANNGKKLTAEEEENLKKYNNNVRKGEADQLRYQSEKKLEGMKERGVPQEQIDKQREEENAQIERFERTGRI